MVNCVLTKPLGSTMKPEFVNLVPGRLFIVCQVSVLEMGTYWYRDYLNLNNTVRFMQLHAISA